jgi:NADH-quinone oxidoreductase subunit L
MVTAGVYLVVRTNVIYQLAPGISLLVAGVGAATALMAATIGLAQNDIKKVLAYSTVSQLGYMFLAAGLGAYSAAVFHLGTHAFFKALLFLASGSVIHAMGGEQDMRKMGGLKRWMPVTAWTFVLGGLAIAGIPGFAGFFSKDEILAAAANGGHWILWAVGLATAGLTAFYMFRAIYMTFFGDFRGSDEQERHLHESPAVMTVPLMVLAAGAVFAGYAGVSKVLAFGRDVNWIHHFLEPVVGGHGEAAAAHGAAEAVHHLSVGAEWALIAVAVVTAIAGILVARAFYGGGRGIEDGEDVLAGKLGGVHRVLSHKYWVDEVYAAAIVRPLAALSRGFFKWVDGFLIDGLLHTSATIAELTGDLGRFTTTGNARNYVLYFFIGIVILLFGVIL